MVNRRTDSRPPPAAQSPPEGEDPWRLVDSDYPADGSAEEKLRFLLGYAILAPSRSNTQPWEFAIRDGAIELHADDARRLEIVDPRGRELVMSCGSALFFLRLAVRAFGHLPVVELFPSLDQPSLLARLRLGPAAPPTDDDTALFHSIRSRRTHPGRFLTRSLPDPLLQALATAAEREESHLVFLPATADRQAVADLVAEGDETLRENPDFWREEAEADPLGQDRHTAAEFFTSFFWPLSAILRIPGRLEEDRRLVLESPALAVLATDGDRIEDWLRAGQALAAVLLRADEARVEASFLSQPIEVLALRPGLQARIGGRVPQLILRLGFTDGRYRPHHPRRPVEDVLRHAARPGD